MNLNYSLNLSITTFPLQNSEQYPLHFFSAEKKKKHKSTDLVHYIYQVMLYCTIFYQRKMSRKLMCERQIFSTSLLYCHSVKDSTYGPNSLGILLLNTMALFFSLRWHKLANRASVYQEPCKQGNWTIKFLEPVDVFSFNLHKQFYKTTLYSYLA